MTQAPRGTVDEPKHVQIREFLRSQYRGEPVGTALPSERALVAQFGVARMTVRQAIDALVAEGVLERAPGKGTFVSRPSAVGKAPLLSFSEEMQARGIRSGGRTLVARAEAAGPGVARALNINPGDPVVHWQRLRLGDGDPVCLQDAFLNDQAVPGFLDRLPPPSLYEEFARRGVLPTWGEDSIEADRARADEADLLGIAEHDPVLRVSRRAFSNDLGVEVSRTTYRLDRFTMWIPLARRS